MGIISRASQQKDLSQFKTLDLLLSILEGDSDSEACVAEFQRRGGDIRVAADSVIHTLERIAHEVDNK